MNGGLTMSKLSTWYQGEKAIQQQAGVADRMEEVGRRVVRDYMPDQHRASQAHLPFIVAGSVDRRGDAWAILVAGEAGFIDPPTPTPLKSRRGFPGAVHHAATVQRRVPISSCSRYP